MREEKYSEIIHDALNFLDDEMIEEVDHLRGGVSVESVSAQASIQEEVKDFTQTKRNGVVGNEQKKPTPWRKWAALAASICLLVVVGNAWEMLQEGVFDTGDLSGGNQASDDRIEGNVADIETDMEDINQSGMIGKLPEAEDDQYGVQDSVGDQNEQQKDYEAELGEPQYSENKVDQEIVNLQNYTAVYFSEVKNQNPSDDYMVMLSEENCEILDKFLDSLQRGTTKVVDATLQSELMNKADGQLIFELEDGTPFHLILIADGMVCSYETQNVWIQMDKRVYRILMESLKENF